MKIRTFVMYECDVCGALHKSAALATSCESSPFPSPMPWVWTAPWNDPPWHTLRGRMWPVFGEDGLRWVEVDSISIALVRGTHETRFTCNLNGRHLSHNADDDDFTMRASVLDPRIGWDAFRYCSLPKDAFDVDTWEHAMRHAGFDPDTCTGPAARRVREMCHNVASAAQSVAAISEVANGR